jgi:hypothetical protein
MLGLENAVDAISDAEKPISQRISERAMLNPSMSAA